MKKLQTAFTLHRTKSIQSRPPENLIKTLLIRYRSLNILALFTRNFEWLSVYIFLWLGGSVWTQTLELSIGRKFVLWHVNVALGARARTFHFFWFKFPFDANLRVNSSYGGLLWPGCVCQGRYTNTWRGEGSDYILLGVFRRHRDSFQLWW